MKINKLKNIFNKYKNIKDIYDVLDIKDKYIVNKTNQKVYIYEIVPILVLDKEREFNNIFCIYNEFLRMQNEKFQIYIDSQKIDLKEYFNNIYDNKENSYDEIKNNMIKSYIKEIEDYNEKNNIILNKYYLVITTDNIKEFDNSLLLLIKLGCQIKLISGKENLTNFLFSKINKVNL